MRFLAVALVAATAITVRAEPPQASVVGSVTLTLPEGGTQASQPGQTTPGQPSRMPARPLRPGEAPPKGTAIIRGYVTAQATGAPVRRAQVRAMAMDGTGAGGVTSTDAEGRFEIRELPAARYSLTAMKGGYVTGQYGQRRPGDPATPIELAESQTADKVSITLGRGAVIAGRILDDTGDPVAGAQVTAVRYAFMAGGRRLMPAPAEGSSDRTDDQGGFRLFGLPLGDYYVSAVNRSGQMMMATTSNNTEAEGFAPTYYPGTTNIGEATRISLKVGQEMTGANFAMVVARLARVRGRATNSQGEPLPRAMLMLSPADPGQMGMSMNNAMVRPDGTFEFTNVAAGRYNLISRPMGMPDASAEFAVVPISVGNDDLDNVMVMTSVGGSAHGVILTDTGEPPPFRANQVQLSATSPEPMMMMPGGNVNKINDDFSFTLSGLSDRRLIRGFIPGWYLKAVFLNGEDVTDRGVDFAPGRAVEGLEVVFTQKATDLSGLVTDDRNRPVVDASVVIFPANRERWGFSTRFLRTLRPDTQGRYSTKGLPPGEDYLVIVVQGLEQGQGGDPEFLARAADEAKPFTLAEGETKAVDVKLSKLAP